MSAAEQLSTPSYLSRACDGCGRDTHVWYSHVRGVTLLWRGCETCWRRYEASLRRDTHARG